MTKYTDAKKKNAQAVKKFTDREEPRNAFRRALDEAMLDKTNKIRVLDFYGLGGIGKTALLAELEKILCNEYSKVKYVIMDFATVVDLGDTLEILRMMERTMREKYGFTFPFFDLVAYTYERKLGKLATRTELESIVDKNQELGFLVDVIGEIPFVDTISKVIKFIGLARKGKNLIGERLTNRKLKNKLIEIDRKSPQETKAELGYYFAEDLTQNIANLAEPFVILFDTYEVLVNEFTAGVPLDNDLFLRGAMGMIENTENALWVVSGREKLKWTELDATWDGSLECYKIGKLSDVDSKWFLNEAGIKEADLVNKICDLSEGVPVYLDLCVDVYYSVIDSGRIPSLDDFGKNTEVLVNRFCTYMDDTERDFIILLAFLDNWTDKTIEGIVKEKGGNFSPTLYEKIKDFSVIVHEGEKYYVCGVVRKVLIANAPVTIRKKFEKDKVDAAKNAVQALNKQGQHVFNDYEQARKLKMTVRESYNSLNIVDADKKDAEILREYLAPDAIRIVNMVRKEPTNSALIDLLKYFIRFHAPYYMDGHYTINEWEEVRSVAEKVLPIGSIYLAKLYMDRPYNKDEYEQYWLLSAEIIFRFQGDDNATLVETILTWLGHGNAASLFSSFSPYGIHSMARIWNKVQRLGSGINDIYAEIVMDTKVEDDFAKIHKEKKALERDGVRKVVQILRRNPDLLTSRVLKLITKVNGATLDKSAHAMLLAYALEIEGIVNKTTDAELLIEYARMIFEFLGGEGNLPTEVTMNRKMSGRAVEILRDILPRYEEVFGVDAEIVAEMICYARKHQVHDGAQAIDELLTDMAEKYGIGTELFAKILRIVSLEYYNDFSVRRRADDYSDLMKLRVLRKWSDKHLEVLDDEMVRKGFGELEEAFGEKFPELGEKAGIKETKKIEKNNNQPNTEINNSYLTPKKVLASDNSPSKARLEAEALKRTKKRRFRLFGKK